MDLARLYREKKTTLLNLIGGLDRATSGEIFIDGVSTKDYDNADWDTYRNRRIGFVFQSYNLRETTVDISLPIYFFLFTIFSYK